jgi:hypothetical protein
MNPYKNKMINAQVNFNNMGILIVNAILIEILLTYRDMEKETNMNEI